MKISRSSLLYRLAHFYGTFNPSVTFDTEEAQCVIHGDLCSFSRGILMGLGVILVIVIAGVVCVSSVLDALCWIFLPDWGLGVGVVALSIITLVAIASAVSTVVYFIRSWVDRAKEDHEPSILLSMYTGIRDKVCFKLTISE